MSKLTDVVTSVVTIFLTVLFYGLMTYGEVFGIYHSVKKHSGGDVIASIAIPPLAWYRSMEMWWHDDYADVNWDKRLSNNIQTCIYFVAKTYDNDANKFEVSEDIEKFSSKINAYPKERRQFLLDGTKKFIQYSQSLSQDLVNSVNQYEHNGVFNWTFSANSKKLEKELSNFKLKEEVEFTKKSLLEANKQMKLTFSDDFSMIDTSRFHQMQRTMQLALASQQKEYKKAFKNLFNEEL